MADNMIELVASLNVDDSAKQINKIDIPLLQNKIKGLNIKCNLDGDCINNIKNVLKDLSNLTSGGINLSDGLGKNSKAISDVTHIADTVEDKIDEIKNNLAQKLGVDASKIITKTIENAKGQIKSFSLEITRLQGQVDTYNYKVNQKKNKETKDDYFEIKPTGSRTSNKGAIQLVKNQASQIEKLTQKLEKLRAGFENKNAPRPILDENNIKQLNSSFEETEKLITKIKSSSVETFDEMVADANKAITAYDTLGKSLRDAENTATNLAASDISSAKSALGGQISRFITQVSKSSVSDSATIIKSAEKIKDSLDKVGDSKGIKTARDELNKLKGEFTSLDAKAKATSFAETLKNRIEKLSASMSVFAEKNERAVRSVQMMSTGKTFAQEWQEISNALTKGNLTPDELRHLQERFTIFGKEAETAGLKGKTAWEKFLGTFKTFSSYITANMVFNVFKRQISNMITEVVNLDSAMTELRKVTEATEPEFNKFLETAKQSAQYLGSSVTDLVDATSTFSRVGYSLSDAQKLGEIATLYKNVGDGIDVSTASETLVSTLKAFSEFNDEATDAIQIVDKLNEVGKFCCP